LKYDIASKVLMERCREEILRRFLGITVLESTILDELPQETVSVKRSDFPGAATAAPCKEERSHGGVCRV